MIVIYISISVNFVPPNKCYVTLDDIMTLKIKAFALFLKILVQLLGTQGQIEGNTVVLRCACWG